MFVPLAEVESKTQVFTGFRCVAYRERSARSCWFGTFKDFGEKW